MFVVVDDDVLVVNPKDNKLKLNYVQIILHYYYKIKTITHEAIYLIYQYV